MSLTVKARYDVNGTRYTATDGHSRLYRTHRYNWLARAVTYDTIPATLDSTGSHEPGAQQAFALYRNQSRNHSQEIMKAAQPKLSHS